MPAKNANPDRPLKGRTALVTGGGKRVGASIARALAQRGARVAIHYLSSITDASALCRELGQAGGEAIAVRADLASGEEIENLYGELAARSFLPDILVNSASIFEPTPDDRADPAGWRRMLAINLTAPYLLSMIAAERMKLSGGDIIMIADVWGMRPLGGHSAYSTSKAGLIMLTKALARELSPTIRVNAIAPGPVLLPDDMDESGRRRALARTPLGREGTPEDVASAVIFLLSGTTYATGSVLTIDGGRSVI